MKPVSSNRFLAATALAFAAFTVVVSADTVTANATTRTFNFSPDANEQTALSLYSDGGGNIQRSWLNFDLSAYSGKVLTTDVTMTLQAGIYGNSLNSVQLGSANASWAPGTITWNNSPSLTIIPDVINPSGIVGPTGPVTWTIPWYVVEKWATAGYNGIGLTSGGGSTQHFYSLADGNPANHPTLTFTSGPNGADGTWTGGNGNWTDSANWAATTVAQGVGKTATINGGSAVTVTMDASRSIGAISFSGANHSIAAGTGKLGLVTTSGYPAITVASGLNASIGATIAGIDGLEKLGTGTLTLSGSNTYSGATYITAGTLVAASNTALGLGGHNGATMSFIQDGTTLALQGGVSLDEHFHVWGAGVGGLGAVRSISGNNTLTNSPGGGPGFALRSNTTVGVDADTLTVSGFYEDSGNFSLTKIGAGTLTMNAVSTYTGGTIVNEGDLVLPSNGGNGRIRGALTVNANGTVETTGDGTGLGYVDQISSVALNGGTLTSAGSMHIWNITGDITMTGGLLQSNNGTSDPNGAYLEWNRTDLTTLASTDTATIAGRIRMRGDNGYPGITFTVADGTAAPDLEITAAITEAAGGRGITKEGPGTMSVTGATTYTGPTTVNAGVLSLGDGSNHTSLNDAAQIAMTTGAQIKLDFTGTDVIGSLTLDGDDQGPGFFNATTYPALFSAGGSGSLFVAGGAIADNDGTWSSNSDDYWEFPTSWSGGVASGTDKTATFAGATGTTVTLAGEITIGNLSFSALDYTITGASKTLALDSLTNSTIFVDTGRIATINSKLTSTGEVFKTGNGILKLYGGAGDNYANVYNQDLSGLDIQAGTVELTSQYIRLGSINIASGATLASSANWGLGSSNPWFDGRSAGPITVQNGGTLTVINGAVGNSIRDGLSLLGGSVTAPGIINGDWGAFILASTLTADGNATSTISADVAVAGTQTVDVASGSTLLVTGNLHNRYAATGGITKEGDGTLVFTGAKTYAGPTTVNFGVLQLGDGTTDGSTPGSTITNNASLVVNPAASQSFSQTVSGSGSLTKTGTGTLAITGPQSYTGDTVVSGGSLELQNNSASVVYGTVPNAGFETPDLADTQWQWGGSDWTFNGGAGTTSSNTTWMIAAPEGDQGGFLQLSSSLSNTVTIPSDGNYLLSFKTANRPGYPASGLTVTIGANTVGTYTSAELSTGGGFIPHTTSPVALTAGTYTLTFQGIPQGADSGTIIDDVKLTNATLTNGSLTFQPGANGVSNMVTGSGTAVMNGKFNLDLSLADIANGNSWTLVNHATLNESYGSDFSVTSSLGDFTEGPAGTWKRTDGDNTWAFTEGTGVLTLAVAPADPLLAWIDASWPSLSDKTPTGDPDNDGIENLVEYVLKNGDPSASNPGILPTVSASGANLVFTYLRRTAATGTTQTFQYGSNLTGWTDVDVVENPGPGVTVAITSPEAGIEQVVITVPKGANTKLFGRLQVVK